MPRKTHAYHTGIVGRQAVPRYEINHEVFQNVEVTNAATAALMGVQAQYRKRLFKRHAQGDLTATQLLRSEYHLLV